MTGRREGEGKGRSWEAREEVCAAAWARLDGGGEVAVQRVITVGYAGVRTC